jgi:hypothetical protein
MIFVTLMKAPALAKPNTIHVKPYHKLFVAKKKPTIETIQKPKLSQIAWLRYDTKSFTYVVLRILCIIGESNDITIALAVAKKPVRMAPKVREEPRIPSPAGNTN